MPKRSHDGVEVSRGEPETRATHREHFRRCMNPCDANVFGTVHGGHILTLMQEVGATLATKYCNQAQRSTEDDLSEPRPEALAVLARVGRADFAAAMFVGEIADAHAHVVYTSAHSLEVAVTVHAENVIKGTRRLTNKSRLWFVPLATGDDGGHVLNVPPLQASQSESGNHVAYQKAKEGRLARALRRDSEITQGDIGSTTTSHSVPYSRTQLTCLVGPADVTTHGNCRPGVVLHMMDECAGVVAAKHCATKVATVSFDDINFRHRIRKGGLLTAMGRAIFTSRRSLEIHVSVREEQLFHGEHVTREVADGFVTFVSLDDTNKAQAMPALRLLTPCEKEAAAAGQGRYDAYRQTRGVTSSRPASAGSVSR